MIARRDVPARLLSRRELSPTCFSLLLATSEELPAEPGQFGMLTCGQGLDPLLRRPFSIAGVRPLGREWGVELLVKEVGRGTGWLRRAPLGTTLELLAPLGHGFNLEAGAAAPAALVAGGIGLPPVLFAAERLAEKGAPFDLFVGAATAQELLEVERCRAAVAAVGGELVLCTDDGSMGEPGFVTAALARRFAAGQRWGRVLACGPDPMLQALGRWSITEGVVAELSLEEPMACGVGVCLGCVVELADGRRVASCKEGPVFEASRLAARWRP
ncbi:MAG: dihydroorotate dehydrogenase electron transfer subunit [Acidobacteriota bacterium]|jgi:dihydroorotate dehydrogenase electron transfer subunit